jgi:ABC-type Fe3+-hydroxamate transport system substrate-binding protein
VTVDRIVSLVPSITETLLAWGVTPVAVTRFCEQPELLSVGGTKDPDLDAIGRLRPDLVVVNDEENRRADVDALVAAGWAVHVVHIESVAGVAPALEGLAARLGVRGEIEAPVLPPPLRRRAFVPIWRRPWMTMNRATYGSSLLQALGVENVFADDGDRYPTVTLEEAAARRADVVLAPSEPYPFAARHQPELERVAPVRLVDGRDLFWWGTRTPAAVARLASALGALRGRSAQ